MSPGLWTSLLLDLPPKLAFLSCHYLVISFFSYPIFYVLLIPSCNYIIHGRSSKCDVTRLENRWSNLPLAKPVWSDFWPQPYEHAHTCLIACMSCGATCTGTMPMCEGKHVPTSTEAHTHRKGRGLLEFFWLSLGLEIFYIPQWALWNKKKGKVPLPQSHNTGLAQGSVP